MRIAPIAIAAALIVALPPSNAPACCAVSRAVDQVVNADQTVIIWWDAEKKTQHFIRQASFKSDADEDIGFIVPSPNEPELEEAGDAAFERLRWITAAKAPSRGFCIGCRASGESSPQVASVEVLQSKRVAGFDAVVLKATAADALVSWLAENEFAYSDSVAAWAKPYVARGWAFTALKVAKGEDPAVRSAAALRISFQADAPLFPYREPESAAAAKALGVKDRLLRIYFISDQAYEGHFENGASWSGKKVYSDVLDGNEANELLRLLNIGTPKERADRRLAGERFLWLTEFEDHWPYTAAPGDVIFSPAKDQSRLIRTASASVDPLWFVVIGGGTAFLAWRRIRPRSA